MNPMKIDTHFHTIFSYDSFNTLSQTVRACQKKGIECVAVTDHNEIEGALQLQTIAPFQVIIGEEIKTREGEIVGLFLKERINPAMSLAETISAIRSQDGLVYLPHPHKMIEDILEEHIDKIDIVEIFNGRNLKQEYNL